MRPIIGALIVLLVAASAHGYSRPAEGVVCRTYAAAKSSGMLRECGRLWRLAEIRPSRERSLTCQLCKSSVARQDFEPLAYSLTQGGISANATSIQELATDVKRPMVVCALLQRCDSRAFALPTLRFNASSTCEDCKKIIDDVRVLIQDNATKSAIATYIKAAVCIHLPLQIVDICKNTIDTYIGVIMDMAANELESGPTCALFGLCPGEASAKVSNTANRKPEAAYSWIHRPAPKGYEFFHSRLNKASVEATGEKEKNGDAFSWIHRPAPKGYEFFHSRLSQKEPSSDEACTECQNVFSRIRDELKNKEFDEKLKNLIKEKLCEAFGYFKSMCEAAVSKEVDAMIDGASKMNITELCVLFRQCPGKLSLFDVQPTTILQKSQPENVQFPIICEFCEYVIKRVLDLTVTNKSEEAISWALNQVCDLFPSATAKKCHTFVQEYGDIIVKAIMDGTAPKVICMGLGLCGPMEGRPVKLPVMPILQGPGCKLCEVVVDTIYQNLESNSTKEEIIEELETVCKYIPHFKDQCISLVDKYASQVIDLIVSGVPPEEVCRALGFCPQHAPAKLGDSCAICEVIFVEIFAKLRENATIEEVEQLLDKVCDYLPSALTGQCKELVEENTAKILDLIMSKATPRMICETLGICFDRKPKPAPRSETCEICKKIIDFIYTKIEDGATEDEIAKVLESVCDYLPFESLRPACHEYVRAYTSVLIELLVNNVPSAEVCQTIGLCASGRLTSRLCSSGPVAWCRDEETARLCAKTEFCTAFVWGNKAPRMRPAVVQKYDCSKLVTFEERCSNERLMRLCGFAPFCLDFKRPLVSITNECRLCRNMLNQRLTFGSHTLDCRIYVNPLEKFRCEKVRSMALPSSVKVETFDSVCKENNLCDKATSGKVPERPRLLGDDPCVWGPSVFCRDADIAANCNTTEYCQKNVWMASRPPLRNPVVPRLSLIDCSRPLAELCVSKDLRYCGGSVLEQCKQYAAQKDPQARETTEDESKLLKREMCKDRPVSFCTDKKMVKLCDMREYCEAMGIVPAPATSTDSTEPDVPETPKICRMGLAAICQSHRNAELCGMVELCKRQFWA